MRCYFMRAHRIEGVEYLESGPDDDLIRQAKRLFDEREGQKFDGFEVWAGNRFVYREPWDVTTPEPSAGEPTRKTS